MTKTKGGVIVVCVGVGAVIVLALAALFALDPAKDDLGTIFMSCLAVIGTLVGSFFGVNAAQAGQKQAEDQAQAARTALDRKQAALTGIAANAEPGSDEALRAVDAANVAI